MPPSVRYGVGAVLLLVGAVMLWTGASRLLLIHDVTGDGQKATAVISTWQQLRGKGPGMVSLEYAFKADAQNYKGTDLLPPSEAEQYHIGDTIDITYSRRHPERSLVTSSIKIWGSMLNVALGIAFCVISIAFALKSNQD